MIPVIYLFIGYVIQQQLFNDNMLTILGKLAAIVLWPIVLMAYLVHRILSITLGNYRE